MGETTESNIRTIVAMPCNHREPWACSVCDMRSLLALLDAERSKVASLTAKLERARSIMREALAELRRMDKLHPAEGPDEVSLGVLDALSCELEGGADA